MKKILTTLLLFIIPFIGFSQPDNGPGDPGGGGDPDDPNVPITGIEILIAAGGLFGAKKIIDSRRKKQ